MPKKQLDTICECRALRESQYVQCVNIGTYRTCIPTAEYKGGVSISSRSCTILMIEGLKPLQVKSNNQSFSQSFSRFPSHLGFVHPLQDVALHQGLPSSSVCCFPNPGGSLLLCYVILPSSAWSSSRPLPSPWLPLCASLCPPIVL